MRRCEMRALRREAGRCVKPSASGVCSLADEAMEHRRDVGEQEVVGRLLVEPRVHFLLSSIPRADGHHSEAAIRQP